MKEKESKRESTKILDSLDSPWLLLVASGWEKRSYDKKPKKCCWTHPGLRLVPD